MSWCTTTLHILVCKTCYRFRSPADCTSSYLYARQAQVHPRRWLLPRLVRQPGETRGCVAELTMTSGLRVPIATCSSPSGAMRRTSPRLRRGRGIVPTAFWVAGSSSSSRPSPMASVSPKNFRRPRQAVVRRTMPIQAPLRMPSTRRRLEEQPQPQPQRLELRRRQPPLQRA